MKAATFSELWERHSKDVYRFALYLSGDPALAEDITAETFLRIWSSPAPVRLPTVKAYLLAIARNLYLHELRRAGRMRPLQATLPDRSRPGEQAEARAELASVLAELQNLPETDRAALLLRAEDGLSYEEIAEVLGISLAAAKVKVHRARLKLAERRVKNEASP